MALEALATPFVSTAGAYPHGIAMRNGTRVLVWAPLWAALLADLAKGVERGQIAARFHNGLSEALAAFAATLSEDTGIGLVALSGGVMQNRLLLHVLYDRLAEHGLRVLVQRDAPANDGGLALGQAAIAALNAS